MIYCRMDLVRRERYGQGWFGFLVVFYLSYNNKVAALIQASPINRCTSAVVGTDQESRHRISLR